MKTRAFQFISLAVIALSSQAVQANDLGKAIDLFKNIQQATQNSQKSAPAPTPSPAPAATPKPAASDANANAPSANTPRPAAAPAPSPAASGLDCKNPANYGKVLSIQDGILNLNCVNNPGFVAPSSTTKFSEGERPLKHPWHKVNMLVSNPYMPLMPVTIAPNIRLGHEEVPGFFFEISSMQCTTDDGLLVKGGAGFNTATNFTGRAPHAYGYWRISAEGAITPYATHKSQGAKDWHICDRQECKTASRETWGRADAIALKPELKTPNERKNFFNAYDPLSKSMAEDKHGNVWVSSYCTLTKVKPDGTEQKILEPTAACEVYVEKKQEPNALAPYQVIYDKSRDEMLLLTQASEHPADRKFSNTRSLWRVTQEGAMSELFTTYWSDPKPSGRKNVLPKGQHIQALSVSAQGLIRFTLNAFDQGDSLKASLAQIEPGSTQIKVIKPMHTRPDPGQPEYTDAHLSNTTIFGNSNACFDNQGNWFMQSKFFIRKLDAKTQRVTTWAF